MSPLVSVPVLSEQTTETQPSVSTASSLRTSTLRSDIFCEAIISEMVTVGISPSGTCAKSAPTDVEMISPRSWPETDVAMSEATPTMMATTAMR